jgi:hypothetical protein
VCHADGSACIARFILGPGGPSCTLRSQTLVSNCDRCRSY